LKPRKGGDGLKEKGKRACMERSKVSGGGGRNGNSMRLGTTLGDGEKSGPNTGTKTQRLEEKGKNQNSSKGLGDQIPRGKKGDVCKGERKLGRKNLGKKKIVEKEAHMVFSKGGQWTNPTHIEKKKVSGGGKKQPAWNSLREEASSVPPKTKSAL